MAGKVYFSAIGAGGKYNLWVSDGTAAGTVMVNAPNAGIAGLAPSSFAALNGQLYFAGFDAAGHSNLFTVDPTTNTAVEIATPAGSSTGLSPGGPGQAGPIAFNGKLYFQGTDASGNHGLFVSDGTGAGTVRLAVPGTSSDFYVAHMARFGNLLAFDGESNVVSSLYLSDGTAAGTTKVAVNGGAPTGLSIQSLAAVGNKLVFTGLTSAYKLALWLSDGTTAGTVPLAVPGLNPAGSYTGAPAGLTSFGNKALFTAVDAQGSVGVWVTDGTVAGTTELPGVVGNIYGVPVAMLSGGRVAFVAANASGQKGVYVTDGTTVTAIQPAGAAASGLAPDAVLSLGGTLLFDGVTASGARVLYSSDGTSAGTAVLQGGVTLVAGNIVSDAVVGSAPSIAPAATPTLQTAQTAVVGTAAPGITGDTLSVSLLADSVFTTGSSVSINAQGQVLYTAGAVTAANAGTDTVAFRVTDTATGQTADGSTAVTLKASGPALGYADATAGTSGVITMDPAAAGGPSYLQSQYIYAGSDSIAFSTQAPSVFIHSGSGNDAIQVSSGQNVLDGGLGSNFETGGTGTDTFFTDARAPGVVWNTIRNFHAGDAATLWGFTAGVSSFHWDGIAGAAGSEGATLRANIVGGAGRSGDGIDASITFTGLSVAQAQGLQIVTGTQAAGNYLYIYNPGV